MSVVSLLALVAVIAASCTAAAGSGNHPSGSGPATTVGTSSSTTTTFPASFGVGIETFHWTEEGPHVFTVTPTGGETLGRSLTTQIRYPTLSDSASRATQGAKPASQFGPFPVIVFAHGFDTMPSTYGRLLGTWVKAGFVVVSPIFPDENASTMAADGATIGNAVGAELENDVFNEPPDIAFVLHRLAILNNAATGLLKGVIKTSDVALAGQSDGGNVVAALAFSRTYARAYASLAVPPKAVAIMSGTAMGAAPTASASSPAVLQIQSDADGCVSPSAAIDLFSALQVHDPHHYFVTLLGAAHLPPFEGRGGYASVVDTVTTDFFKLELNWRSSALSAAALHDVATVRGISELSTTVNGKTMPVVSPKGGC